MEIEKLEEIINKEKINFYLYFFEYIFSINLYKLLSKEEKNELFFRANGDSEILEYLEILEKIKK